MNGTGRLTRQGPRYRGPCTTCDQPRTEVERKPVEVEWTLDATLRHATMPSIVRSQGHRPPWNRRYRASLRARWEERRTVSPDGMPAVNPDTTMPPAHALNGGTACSSRTATGPAGSCIGLQTRACTPAKPLLARPLSSHCRSQWCRRTARRHPDRVEESGRRSRGRAYGFAKETCQFPTNPQRFVSRLPHCLPEWAFTPLSRALGPVCFSEGSTQSRPIQSDSPRFRFAKRPLSVS